MKNSLLKNSILKSILSICNIIIPLIVGPYVTRLLDINLYGAFNKVIAEYGMFIIFGTFGVYTYGVKEISKIRDDKEKVSELFTNLFVISLITNTIVMVIYIIYANATSTGITKWLYMITLIEFISNMLYVEYVNEALENYDFITKKTLIVRIIYLICVFLFVRQPQNIILYAIIFCLSTFVNYIVSYVYIKKRISFDFSKLQITKYIKPLLIVFLVTSSEALYFQLDKVLLGKLVNDVAVTMYQIPYSIMSRIITIPTSVIMVSIPRLSNLFAKGNKEEYVKKLNDVLSYFYIMVLPICLGIAVLSNEIIRLYAGEKYLAAGSVLAGISLIRILIGMESFMSLLVFYINNKEKQLLKIFFVFGILNVIFKFVINATIGLTPLNALLSTGLCYFMLITTQYIYIKKVLNIDLNIFNKTNIKYMALVLTFVPLAYLVRCLNLPFIPRTVSIMFVCAAFYCGYLYFSKDKIFNNVLKKFLKKKVTQ